MRLEDRYHKACRTPGNIHEHLPTLRAMASVCDGVVEIGTNEAVSTVALLAAQPLRLVTVDINPSPAAEELVEISGATMFDMVTCDSLTWDGMGCEMLFIDSLHTAEQLSRELAIHSPRCSRWIVLHDTETFGETGEDGGRGLMYAVWEFLGDNRQWERVSHWPNCNGLTLLGRVR